MVIKSSYFVRLSVNFSNNWLIAQTIIVLDCSDGQLLKKTSIHIVRQHNTMVLKSAVNRVLIIKNYFIQISVNN